MKRFTLSARVQFRPGGKTKEFTLHGTGEKNEPWRFVSEDCAVILAPLCDSLARLVPEPPLFERVEIWPVRFSYPDSLLTDHPEDVEQMRQDHLAGKHDGVIKEPTAENREKSWLWWLDNIGKLKLWERYRTPELARRWLVADEGDFSPAFMLFLSAVGQPGGDSGILCREELDRIQFRADFWRGEKCQTIYLADCAEALLTPGEKQMSPSHTAQQEKRLRVQGKQALPWHSEGFSAIYLRGAKGNIVDRLQLNNEFRALCQLLAEHADQTAQFSEIEPQIGTRTRQLDTDVGQGLRASQSGERRVRDLLRTHTGKKLRKWGVLHIRKLGREKFVALVPPKPAK